MGIRKQLAPPEYSDMMFITIVLAIVLLIALFGYFQQGI